MILGCIVYNGGERINMPTIKYILTKPANYHGWKGKYRKLTCFRRSASDEYGDQRNSKDKLDTKCSLPFNIFNDPVDVSNS